MKTGIKERVEPNLEIQAMTLLYKQTYDELWGNVPEACRCLILEDPLGRRAKDFAHEVAKQAEVKRAYQLDEEEEQ